MTTDSEIEINFSKFTERWRNGLNDTQLALDQKRPIFLASYLRLVSLNAWREAVLEPLVSMEALAFFVEAQNDALVSHVSARMGAWRSSLKALRSCLENVLYCCYYKDHPVEYAQWSAGEHRLSFSDLLEYFVRHPVLKGVPDSIRGLDGLKAEFSTLSKAVHGSATGFRMTKDGAVATFWTAEMGSLGPWVAREKAVLVSVNKFLLSMFRESLQGTARAGLRASIADVITATDQSLATKELKVKFPKK